MTDLWPEDIVAVTLKAPVSILQEQATLLGKRTQNIVEGHVTDLSDSAGNPTRNGFYFSFEIVSSTVSGYKYRLFSMYHEIEIYPLTLRLDSDVAEELGIVNYANEIKVDDEEEFLSKLRSIFATNKTKLIVRALLAQTQGLLLSESPSQEKLIE